MKILALDLSSDCGSLAVLDGEGVREEKVLDSQHGYADTIFQEIQAALARCGWGLDQIDGLACASGPGAFTGVRVGLTVAMSLGEALGKKVVPVSNLRALASLGTADRRAPVIDARRGDVFVAVYDRQGTVQQPESLVIFDQWSTQLDKTVELLDSRVEKRPLAVAIGKIAAGEFAAGRAMDPADIDANYVRRSDAELAWRDERSLR